MNRQCFKAKLSGRQKQIGEIRNFDITLQPFQQVNTQFFYHKSPLVTEIAHLFDSTRIMRIAQPRQQKMVLASFRVGWAFITNNKQSIMKLKTLLTEGQKVIEVANLPPNNHQKSFPILGTKGQCQYLNSVYFEKNSGDSQNFNKIKIANKLCSESGDMLEKITTIKFNNQTIVIRDLYKFDNLGSRLVEEQTNKRVQLFKKPLDPQQIQDKGTKLMTKNLPKNFIKAFMNYLQQVSDIKNKQLLECKMKLFCSRHKYNNKFIQRIIDDQDLQPYFKDFLENHAKNWINQSKITNKKVHLQKIDVFLNLRKSRVSNKKAEQTLSHSGEVDQAPSPFDNNSIQNENGISIQQSERESVLANSSKSFDFRQQ